MDGFDGGEGMGFVALVKDAFPWLRAAGFQGRLFGWLQHLRTVLMLMIFQILDKNYANEFFKGRSESHHLS